MIQVVRVVKVVAVAWVVTAAIAWTAVVAILRGSAKFHLEIEDEEGTECSGFTGPATI